MTKRRDNLNYTYNVYREVNGIPKTSDLGERVNIFLTELNKISRIVDITLRFTPSRNFVYFNSQQLQALLSHTRYKEVIQDLQERGVIRRASIKSKFQTMLYCFDPCFLDPIDTGVKIRNLKVRNGVRRYLGIQSDTVDENVISWTRSSLLETEIVIDEEMFFDNTLDKYQVYKRNKILQGLKFKNYENYLEDLARNYFSVLHYQQLDPIERTRYIKQDAFSGRIYTIATGVPKWVRSYIRLQGEPVAEIDMKSTHPYLLFHILRETDYMRFVWELTRGERDIYQAYGDLVGISDRAAVKYRFLRSIYGRMNSKYYKEFKSHFPEAGKVIDEIKQKTILSNPSKKGTYTNLAFKLMNKEVKLFRKVWEGMYLAGIPFLPIHDGILVPASRLSEARVLMEQIIKRSIPIVQTSFRFL
jgi:hypothetical protein